MLGKAPNLSELVQKLSPIAHDWYIIGVRLGIENTDLESLQRTNDKDHSKLSQILQLWKDRRCKPFTWDTILKTIKDPPIQNESLVKEMNSFLECEYLLH